METMKILSILVILVGFSQCGTPKFVKNPPFKIESATYNNWVGGLPGVRGTKVEILLSEKVSINVDSLYFQGKVTNIEMNEVKGNTLLIGHYNTSRSQSTDLVLHSNTTMELKNKVPPISNFPFELKENEAVISYKVGNKTKFYKIGTIKKTISLPYPSANK